MKSHRILLPMFAASLLMSLLSLFVMQSPQSVHAAPHLVCTHVDGTSQTPGALSIGTLSLAPENQFYGTFKTFTLNNSVLNPSFNVPYAGAVSVEGTGCPRFTQVGWKDSREIPNGEIFAWHLLMTDKTANSTQLLTLGGNATSITFDGVKAQSLFPNHQYQFQVNASYYPNDNQSLPFVTTNFSAAITIQSLL